MAHTSTSIYNEVSVSDVRAVLGESARSVIDLCRSSRINMWSLCKPVIHQTPHDITDAQRAEASYGFEIKSYNTPGELLDALTAGTAWRYARPDGRYAGGLRSAWQPCRLRDFAGYDHAAEPFAVSPGDIALNPDKMSYKFFAAQTVSSGLSWYDIGAYASSYPCVAVFDHTGALVGWKTASSMFAPKMIVEGEIPDRTVTLTVNRSGADLTLTPSARYTYLMCAASSRKTSFTGVASANTVFRPIPADPALTGALRYSTTIDYLAFSIAGVLGNTAVDNGSVCKFRDPVAANFIGPVGDTAAYLGLGNSGYLVLLLRIDNSDTLPHSQTFVRVRASQTLAGGTNQTEVPEIYSVEQQADGSSRLTSHTMTAVTIPAKSTAYYALSLPYLMRQGADGIAVAVLPEGAIGSPIITLNWGDNGADQSTHAMLRVKQGADAIISTNITDRS